MAPSVAAYSSGANSLSLFAVVARHEVTGAETLSEARGKQANTGNASLEHALIALRFSIPEKFK
jgi:hypothetical protein